MQDEYNEIAGGAFADADKAKCPCKGGWYLSDFDTWHECPEHHAGEPHPEDMDPREGHDGTEDYEAQEICRWCDGEGRVYGGGSTLDPYGSTVQCESCGGTGEGSRCPPAHVALENARRAFYLPGARRPARKPKTSGQAFWDHYLSK